MLLLSSFITKWRCTTFTPNVPRIFWSNSRAREPFGGFTKDWIQRNSLCVSTILEQLVCAPRVYSKQQSINVPKNQFIPQTGGLTTASSSIRIRCSFQFFRLVRKSGFSPNGRVGERKKNTWTFAGHSAKHTNPRWLCDHFLPRAASPEEARPHLAFTSMRSST